MDQTSCEKGEQEQLYDGDLWISMSEWSQESWLHNNLKFCHLIKCDLSTLNLCFSISYLKYKSKGILSGLIQQI